MTTTGAQAAAIDRHVSRETSERLEIYATLLVKWQARINLIAETTATSIWRRHFADSLQLRRIVPDALRWIDMGSGAGFPGLVVAIDLADDPAAHVHLIESNGKKCAFLREVVRETGARATIVDSRIEQAMPAFSARCVDVVTARALAPLTILLGYSEQVLKTGARGLFLKGQDVEQELTDSTKCWNLDYQLHRSETDPDARIVEITNAVRRDP
ncbi:MAG: 16S rRNA (guanine(527)-N(7))-methyltransferase RsmG [Beijerinckiaceae bacterium]|nr:16S rRNA (guanine(527)-N(7))-methyltransferase RsmG [Beijerinckiaceae bacterium]